MSERAGNDLALIDAGGANLGSVRYALDRIGARPRLVRDADELGAPERIILPGVGAAVPSMALLASIKSLNLNSSDVRLNPGESVQIGKLRVKTDEAALMLPQFYKGRDGKPAFAVDSFYDVISGKIPASKYADKIVLIGATAAGVGVRPAGGDARRHREHRRLRRFRRRHRPPLRPRAPGLQRSLRAALGGGGAGVRVGAGDRIEPAGTTMAFDVIEVPGHTSSHIAYAGMGALFCGDTLFSVGCGSKARAVA